MVQVVNSELKNSPKTLKVLGSTEINILQQPPSGGTLLSPRNTWGTKCESTTHAHTCNTKSGIILLLPRGFELATWISSNTMLTVN